MLSSPIMLIRRIMPLLALLLCSLWLVVWFVPVVPQDRHGYNDLAAILAINALLLCFAVICVVFSAQRLLSWPFTLSLLSITPLHWWGAGVDAPGCYLFFFPPFIMVLITGIWSSREAKSYITGH
jgi:hypothetical protein